MAQPADIYNEFSVRIYEPPLSSMRDDASITDASSPVAVLMLIIDFMTERQMNGFEDFIGNATGRFARNTADAMRAIGCTGHGATLDRALDIADAAGMTFEAIQGDRQNLAPTSISSFEATHGDKWDAAIDKIEELLESFDLGQLVTASHAYIGAHLAAFQFALSTPDT